MQKTIRPLFPDYCSRKNLGTTWHYAGYWQDSWLVWSSFYWLIFRHPILAFKGFRMSLMEIVYRVPPLKPFIPLFSLFSILITLLMPILFAPVIFLLIVLPVPKPKMFRPFTVIGYMNYCAMLAIVSIFHTNIRLAYELSPKLSREYSDKLFWRSFFNKHLTLPSRPTQHYGTVENNQLQGELPKSSFLVKPRYAGAGYGICVFTWNFEAQVYECVEHYQKNQKQTFTEKELKSWLLNNYQDAVIESFETPIPPFCTSSLRIMTVRFEEQPELLSQVLLAAPKESISTAHAEVCPFLIDYETKRMTASCRNEGDDAMVGLEIPDLHRLVKECLHLHKQLPFGQIEVSWDIILSDDGPVYLEGNIIPPGCDYKILIFENKENLRYFINRYMAVILKKRR